MSQKGDHAVVRNLTVGGVPNGRAAADLASKLPPAGKMDLDVSAPMRGDAELTEFEDVRVVLSVTVQKSVWRVVAALRAIAHRLRLHADDICEALEILGWRALRARAAGELSDSDCSSSADSVWAVDPPDPVFGNGDGVHVEGAVCLFSTCVDLPSLCSRHGLFSRELFVEEERRELVHRLGRLVTLDLHGIEKDSNEAGPAFKLDLAKSEDRTCATLLQSLAAAEGGVVRGDVEKELPHAGVCALTYECSAPDVAQRDQLAARVLGRQPYRAAEPDS